MTNNRVEREEGYNTKYVCIQTKQGSLHHHYDGKEKGKGRQVQDIHTGHTYLVCVYYVYLFFFICTMRGYISLLKAHPSW